MLAFTYRSQPVSLKPGDAWTPPSDADSYRDAPAGELREIVASVRAGTPWRDTVARHYAKTNPWLHRIVTSPQRDLFFRQHPPARDARVLDIGSGWGQTAVPLARSGCTVAAVEPTPERLAFVQAVAAQERIDASMNFIQADFLELEFPPLFDLATCIGVLEWTPKFRPGDPREIQAGFLKKIRRTLAPGGRLVLGIENRLGLKYLLGARDDHIATANVAVYDSALASAKWQHLSGQPLRSFTYTRIELQSLLEEAGFAQTRFFAALPDYKVPEKILPLGDETEAFFAAGGFVPEHDGCDGKPLGIQDELRSHYRSFATLGTASDFVPSFFVEAKP